MKRLLILIFPLIILSCQGKTAEKKHVHCSNSTVLAEGMGFKISLADYRYVQTLLNPRAKKFFLSHKEDLLDRMINRKVVLLYVRDSGLAKKYGLERDMEAFKKRYLSRLYVSKLASRKAGKVTDKEIEERFKELFPKRKVESMTDYDRAFIRNELTVKKYDEAVQEIYRSIR